MSCLPTYKGKRYNSLEELYNANGVNTQQAQQLFQEYINTTGKQDIEGFKEFVATKRTKEIEAEPQTEDTEQSEAVKPTQKPKATTKPKQQPAKQTTASIPNTINTSVEKLPIKFKHKSLPIVNEAIAVQNGVLRATDLEVFIETPTDKADGVYNVLGSNKLFESEKKVDEFPIVPRVQGEFMDLPIAVSDISSRINEVSKDEWQPIMGGVHLQSSDGKLSIMTTDAHTLRVKIVDTNLPDFAINISQETLKALKKLKGDANVRIKFDDKYIVFDLGNGTQITSRLLEGKYPNISAVMPNITEYKEIKIKGDLNSIIEGVRNYYNNKKRDDIQDVRSEYIVLNIDGFEIGVKIAYLSKYTNATLYVGTSPTKSILFKDNTNNTFGLIMPVMIQSEEESGVDLDKNIVADAEFVEGEVEIPEYNNIPAQTNSKFNAIQEATADTKLSQLSIQERVTAVQNAVEQINDGRVVEYVDDMHTYLIETYANEPDILARIESLHKSGGKVGGITRGDIIIINTNRATIQGCLSTFEHERQHLEVKNNPLWQAIKQDIIQNTDRQILDDAVVKLSNTLFYRELGIDDLADEYIAHVIQNVFDNKKINTNLKYQNIIEDEYRRQNGNRLARIDGWSTRTDNVTAGSGGQLTIDYGAAEGGLLGSSEVGAEIDELGLGEKEQLSENEIPDYKKLQNVNVDFDNVDTALDDKLKEIYSELYEDIEVLFLDREITRMDFPPTALLQLSNKLKTEFIDKLKKKRQDLVENNLIDSVIESIEVFAETNSKNDSKLEVKLQKLAFHWTLNGQVILPEDSIKILQAIKISKIKGIDLFTYDSPNEVISQYAEIKEDVPLIDPDTIKEFKNKKDIGDGVTWYEVDNTEEGRKAARSIIDTHFGENDNPWCLLAKDVNGNIEATSSYWFETYSGEKRIAFQNGKLIAFYGGTQWWNRLDEPSNGIPITKRGKFIDDGKGRARQTVIVDENDSNIVIENKGYERGDKTNGLYESWDADKNLRAKSNYKDRKLDGEDIEYYDNGNIKSETTYKDGNEDGKYTYYYDNGNIKSERTYKDGELDGKLIRYYKNGNIQYEKTYKDGKLDGESIVYDNYKILGVADIENKRILIDDINKKQDTLSHEYAHHYIRAFINTPIVQEAITKWGSEEALVQAIGEQAVKQKGEAYNWWVKFSKWIKSIFNNLDVATKEELLAVLTEGFLTRQDLNSEQDTGGVKEGVSELFESIPITESMKESVMEGMPLFQAIAPESTDNATIVGELSTDVNPDNAKQASRVRESYVDKYLEIKKRLSDKNTNMVDAYQGVLQFIEALAKDKTWAKWDKTALPQLRSIRDSVRELKKAGAHYSILKKLDMAMELVLQRQYNAAEKIIKNFAKLKVEGTTAKGVKIQKKIDVTAATFFQTLGSALPNGQDVNMIESRIQNLQLELDAATDQSIKDNLEAQIKALTLVKQHKISQSAYNINIGLLVDDINKITQEYNLRDKRREIMRAYGKISSNNKKIDDPETTNKEELRKQNDDIRANIEILKGEYKQLKSSVKHDKQSKKDVQLFKNMLLNERLSQQKEMEWFIKELDTILGEGIKAKRTFVAKEKEHKDKINSEALRAIGYNSDKSFINPAKSESKKTAWSKIIHSIDSFSSMLKLLDVSAADGRGLLYTMFFTDGYTKANKSEQIGLRASTLDLDKKIQYIFGKGFQLSQLQKLCKQHNGASVTVKSAAGTKINEDGTTEQKYKEETFELDNGQALYIYAIAKMPDGMIKLNAMGIDQEQIDAVEDTLTDELKEYQDWVQGEFLPKLRIKYNATHIQLFGTQLDQIENYFKLNISKGDLQQDVQIDDSAGYYGLPKTDTGSILKRVYNKNAIDIKNSNAIETLIEHLHKMEHWNAFAPLIKDLNTLNSNPAFTKHINRYIYNGAAEDFQRACKIAVGAYVPAGKGGLEEAIVATMRLYSAGKIAFRLNTALKQQLALIQILGYGDLKLVGNSFKAAINPMSIKWCMDNIPDFFKRWNDRAGGDNTLMIRGDMDGTAFEKLHNRISDLASKGMIPNAAVDLWSCAIIAKGMYETKLVYYQSRKYSEEESKSKALTDAEIAYNETMQSAEAGYLSYIQKDKTLWSSVFSLFNNSSISYQRLLIEGFRGIGKQMSRKQRADMIAFQKAKYLELGRTPEDASKFANSDVNMALRKNIMQVAMNGYIVQLVWNLGSAVGMMKAVQYLITFCGDDDDEKDRALEELKEDLKTSALKSFTTPVRGLPFGKEIESTVELYLRGWNWRQINVESNPLISDTKEFGVNMEEGFKKNDWVRILNGLVRYGVGFAGLDLNTVANITYGIHDLVENHEDITTTDVMYDLSLMINAPRSEQKFLGVSVRDDDTYEDILQRYISLKRVHKYGVFSPLTEVEDVRASQDVSKMVNVKYYTLRDMIREYERAADKYNERNPENRINIYDNEALYNANSVMNSFSYEAKSSVLNKEQLNEIHTAIEALKNDKSLDETFTNMNIFLWRNSNKQQKEAENINF